jgi:hypothetical protein
MPIIFYKPTIQKAPKFTKNPLLLSNLLGRALRQKKTQVRLCRASLRYGTPKKAHMPFPSFTQTTLGI